MIVVDLVHMFALAVVIVAVTAPAVALGVFAIASLRRPPAFPPTEKRIPIAVLIAAHDEREHLPATLAALAEQVDPAIKIHVVADNCSDETADVATRAGACVHIREDQRRPGKAAALNWLAARVLREEPAAEAFVFVDADAHAARGFFDAFRRALATGARVAQGANLVRTGTAPLTRLRDLAFHMRCELRPLALEAFGASAGLHGNGMCFRRDVLEHYRWDESSVVEDGEMHARLARDGIRVRFVADAVVRSSMPDRFAGAAGQAMRWERGKSDLLRAGIALIARAVAQRRPALAVLGYESLIPPLSFLVAASVGVALAGEVIGDAGLAAAGIVALAACGLYLARGLALARFGPRTIADLAPWVAPYIAWKVAIFARSIAGGGRGEWSQARAASPAVGLASTTEQ